MPNSAMPVLPPKKLASPLAPMLSGAEMLLFAGGTLIFLVLLYHMQAILNPAILSGACVILLWPIRRHKIVHAILLSGGFLLLVWFFVTLSGVLLPFVSVYIFAYLFDPVVTYLHRRYGVHRGVSSLFVTLMIVSVVALLGLFLIPNVLNQLDTIANHVTTGLRELRAWLLTSPLVNYAVPGDAEKEALAGRLTQSIQSYTRAWTERIPSNVGEMMQSIGPVFNVLMIALVMPVILFYMLKDYRHIKTGIIQLLPLVGGQRTYLKKVSSIVGNYLRGQLTISVIGSIIVTVALMIAKVPFALLIGLIAGMLNMIPNLGAIITNMVGICIALVFGDRGLLDVVLVVTILLGQSLLEQAVLVPRILSHHVGLHPVLILFSLFVFGALMGVLGLFVAVPAMALIATVFQTYQGRVTFDLSTFAAPHAQEMERGPEPNLFGAGGVTNAPERERKEQPILEVADIDLLEH
ncbi:MAG: AI-2E family transporter [Rhodothermales bacterium]